MTDETLFVRSSSPAAADDADEIVCATPSSYTIDERSPPSSQATPASSQISLQSTPAPTPTPIRRTQPSQTPSLGLTRVSWPRDAIRYFLSLCQTQVNEGVLVNMRLPILTEAMDNIKPAMVAKFARAYETTTLINKFRSLLIDYRKVKTLLRSGVGYDNESGKISVEDESWEAFVKRYPYLKAVRQKGFPFMDEMALLWPDEVSSGEHIVEAARANDPVAEISDEEAEEELELRTSRSRRRRASTALLTDPEITPRAAKRASRPVEQRYQVVSDVGSSIERGLSNVVKATTAAPRDVGADDMESAFGDFQELFAEKLGDRAVARMGRFFAASSKEAVIWKSIKSLGSKEAFLREIGIMAEE